MLGGCDCWGKQRAAVSLLLVKFDIQTYVGKFAQINPEGGFQIGMTIVIVEWSITFQTLFSAINRRTYVNFLQRYCF